MSGNQRCDVMLAVACMVLLPVAAAAGDIALERPVPRTGNVTVRMAREVLSRCTVDVLTRE